MRKNVRGSVTVEASVIVPLLLFIFVVLVNIFFYYHDKNILMSTAYETAALAVSREDMEEIDLEYYFFSRMEGKVLLFDRIECAVKIQEDQVLVTCDGSKNKMCVEVEYKMGKTKPEDYIRNIRKLEKIGEGIVKK